MRPKDIGTRGETAVTRYLRDNGFPGADRQPLRGRADTGDIDVTAGIIAEVKAGAAAATASNNRIRMWMYETDRERRQAEADIGILVVRQRGRGPSQWHVWTTVRQLGILQGAISEYEEPDATTPVMLLLSDWCDLARINWGDDA